MTACSALLTRSAARQQQKAELATPNASLDGRSSRCSNSASQSGTTSDEEEMAEALDPWVCPLTRQLPVDPVTAEDGHVYERSAISSFIRRATASSGGGADLISPVSGKRMGPRLTTAFEARDTIEAMVRRNELGIEEAKHWLSRQREDAQAAEAARIIQSVTGAVATGRLGPWIAEAPPVEAVLLERLAHFGQLRTKGVYA
mmetsp:Transcript_26298/g.76385  ORF Transcript_26298/g.76385 Transcript_26298/m.76385 type:complete len:202 (+) Transcript_26298:45-650(+)